MAVDPSFDGRTAGTVYASDIFQSFILPVIIEIMNTERYKKLTAALEHIMHVLTTQYQPEKVILFGSLAEGTVGEWSDIDLVIIKDTSLPFLQRLKEVALLCRVSVSVDFLVYTPNEFAQMIADNNPLIVKEILQKGKVLYEYEPAAAVA
jgi:predicted nucleotidyltransferase